MKSATFNSNFNSVFAACQKALKQLDIQIQIADRKNKTITGSTSTSFWSWGENIQINLAELGDFNIKIDVESSSPNQLITWGKNDENEHNIIATIKQILKT